MITHTSRKIAVSLFALGFSLFVSLTVPTIPEQHISNSQNETSVSQLATPVHAQEGLTNPALTKFGDDTGDAECGTTFEKILSVVLGFMMVVGALLVLLNLVQAGINWIGSGGDTSKVQKARDTIIQAIIGLIIMSAALAIFKLLSEFLGLDLNFLNIFPGGDCGGSSGGSNGYNGAPNWNGNIPARPQTPQ